jgi:Zn-dependent M16 (insulinase) family peptidase
MRVLNQILSTDYLQTRIRVIGGAYGGFSSINPSGFMSFNSYRDPNLKETLNNYDSIPSFLRTFDADEKEMTRFIIGTIAGIDTPLTPSSKGDQAVNYYFTRRTAEEVQHDRDMVITTTAGDIRGFEKLTQAVLNQKAYCVYGNANKIEQEKDLFKTLLKIEKQ